MAAPSMERRLGLLVETRALGRSLPTDAGSLATVSALPAEDAAP